jgi:ATP synthase H subunit
MIEESKILLEIKNAEEKVRDMLHDATTAKEKILAEAKMDANKIIHEGETKAREIYDNIIKNFEHEIKQEKQKILNKHIKEIDDTKKRVKANMEECTQHLLKEFERSVNAYRG